MGKRLIQQARGKGGPTYRSPSFRFAKNKLHPLSPEQIGGRVLDFYKCPGHSAPLAKIKYEDDSIVMFIAPEGLKVGDTVSCGGSVVSAGNTLTLKDIPVGTALYNIESRPGDGGKFCRGSGTFAKLIEKQDGTVLIELPSKKTRSFDPDCRANIGIAAGGGRLEKPLLKAGNSYHKYRAKNKLFPRSGGTSMNAVDHPFGGKSSHTKGRPTQASRNAPPGRKVGKIAPRRTGYRG